MANLCMCLFGSVGTFVSALFYRANDHICTRLAAGAKSGNLLSKRVLANGSQIQIRFNRLDFMHGRQLPTNRANMQQRLFESPVSGSF